MSKNHGFASDAEYEAYMVKVNRLIEVVERSRKEDWGKLPTEEFIALVEKDIKYISTGEK